MDIIVKQETARVMGYKSFVPFGIPEDNWKGYRTDYGINLGALSRRKIDDLEALLGRYQNTRGVKIMLQDIRQWKRALDEDGASLKARTVRQFEPLAQRWLLKVPGHRLYKRHDEGCMLAYYVESLEYTPPNERQDRPAHVSVNLYYQDCGKTASTSETFYAKDVIGIPVVKVFAERGYVPESDKLRAEYLATKARYFAVHPHVGRQFLATGPAEIIGQHEWSRDRYALDIDGTPTKVVVDVFDEEKDHDRGYVSHPSPFYWTNIEANSSYDPETDENDAPVHDDDDTGSWSTTVGGRLKERHRKDNKLDEDDVEPEQIEVPVHPWVVAFDLKRHERIYVHVNQLTEYVYDEALAEKLVLPREQKDLVKLLIETKGGMFRDIVEGKSGGSVVLLAGPPGVGKTLTAEVYAESEKRPLYSVQCSQLGLDAEELEKALLVTFARARRWNAVMLLDEADVYVKERGGSLQQNAIVGVFLRVLEYQATVLFLTTNRPEDVDDAIASRCIARLVYAAPEPEEAKRIWKVLVETSGATVRPGMIDVVVERNPGMTGRDIKNILKLARLMPGAERGITSEMVAYVQQFKPTGGKA